MITEIKSDFLDREQDSFVKIRKIGRLGWESLIPEGGSYSDILLSCRETEDVVKEAYTMAKDYITAMDTPFRVTLRLSPKSNCTDSKVVYLATKVFDETDMTLGQKIDTFVGLAVHEGCHLKWTDFTDRGYAVNAVVRDLANIIEDERIERLCGEHMPGYANFLKATKYYMFGRYVENIEKNPPVETLEAAARLLNAILGMIRYPKSLADDDVEEFASYLYRVRQILMPFPESYPQVLSAAEAIYEVIKEFFEKEKQQQSQQEELENHQDETEPNENSEDSQNESGDTSHSDLEESLHRQMQPLSQDPQQGSTPMDKSEVAQCIRKDNYKMAGVCENTVDIGQTSGTVLYKATENRDRYDESYRKIRRYIPVISKALRNHCTEYQVSYHGMRSGILDTGKLAEAYQGVQSVYVREGKVKSDKMAVCVLIDESGSMYGEKMSAARDLAVLLNEAVSGIPAIELYVYGHTYGDQCRDSYRAGEQIAEIHVYREKGFSPRKALGGAESRSGNLDSLAIREAAHRMRKFSKAEKNLMFVITDGAPNERYDILTSTVKKLEKEGMEILAICIDPSYDPSLLYTHHVKFTDMGAFAAEIGKMIKRTILMRSKRTME